MVINSGTTEYKRLHPDKIKSATVLFCSWVEVVDGKSSGLIVFKAFHQSRDRLIERSGNIKFFRSGTLEGKSDCREVKNTQIDNITKCSYTNTRFMSALNTRIALIWIIFHWAQLFCSPNKSK